MGGSGQAAIQGGDEWGPKPAEFDEEVRQRSQGSPKASNPGLPLSRFRCVGRGLRTSSAKSDRGDIKALMAVMSSYEEFLVSGRANR